MISHLCKFGSSAPCPTWQSSNASPYSLSSEAPVGVGGSLVGGGDPLVGCSCPEPAVNVDGLEVVSVASLALEVALTTRRVHRAHVI